MITMVRITSLLTTVASSSASLLQSASALAVLIGGIYLVDCRVSAKGSDAVDRCYFTALPLMGVGVAGRGGFSVGYNTLNPSLRQPEEEEHRGERVRFGRKDHN